LLRIGLTGGIGAGKSTVAGMFAARGVPVIDADAIAHEVVAPGGRAYNEVVAAFGSDYLLPDRTLDRAKLRAHVFADPGARQVLEGIVHPHVRIEINARLRDLDAPYCLIVIPLLFESRMEDTVNRVLTVEADDGIRIARVMARSRIPEGEVRAIMAAQLPAAQRRLRAHDVIENSGAPEALEKAVAEKHATYSRLAAAEPG
jgi:dephospho-CoA kinase